MHAGPFGNIAHGCNSVLATRSWRCGLSEITVTEAGFGADLGAEKFFDIKCRSAGLRPDAAVVVATVRALKLHGGAELKELSTPDPAAVEKGLEHLEKHVENVRSYGMPVVVCLNAFVNDTPEETEVVIAAAERLGVEVIRANPWEHGGKGSEELARAVVALAESGKADFRTLYPERAPLLQKVETIAKEIYGARAVVADGKLRKRFQKLEEDGYGDLPICIAKTQYSFSTDPSRKGRPKDFEVPLRAVELRAGAGFILVLTGSIMTMPGLPRVPAAENIDVDGEGQIVGLF